MKNIASRKENLFPKDFDFCMNCSVQTFSENTESSTENDVIFDKLVWTINDVAKELKCSVRHVYKLISDDRIPYSKVGRLVRFSPAKVHE